MAPPIDTVAATKVTPPGPPSRYIGRARLLDRLGERHRHTGVTDSKAVLDGYLALCEADGLTPRIAQ